MYRGENRIGCSDPTHSSRTLPALPNFPSISFSPPLLSVDVLHGNVFCCRNGKSLYLVQALENFLSSFCWFHRPEGHQTCNTRHRKRC